MRTLLLGAILGAIAGILYAPWAGSRTRTLLRDKWLSAKGHTAELFDNQSKTAKSRIQQVSDKLQDRIEEVKPQINKLTSAAQDVYQSVREGVADVRQNIRQTVSDARDRMDEETAEETPGKKGEGRRSA